MPDPLYEVYQLLGNLKASVDGMKDSQKELKEQMAEVAEKVTAATNTLDDISRESKFQAEKVEKHERKLAAMGIFQKRVNGTLAMAWLIVSMIGSGIAYLLVNFLPDIIGVLFRAFGKTG